MLEVVVVVRVTQSWSLKNVENKLVIRCQFHKISLRCSTSETLDLISLIKSVQHVSPSLPVFKKCLMWVSMACSPISAIKPMAKKKDRILWSGGNTQDGAEERHHEIFLCCGIMAIHRLGKFRVVIKSTQKMTCNIISPFTVSFCIINTIWYIEARGDRESRRRRELNLLLIFNLQITQTKRSHVF